MPRARKHLVCLAETPYYHLTSRCVRRAFLCGIDHYSGKSYEHRRAWVEDRIRVLSSIFQVDVYAHAVMSNHYHLVVRLTSVDACNWSDEDDLERRKENSDRHKSPERRPRQTMRIEWLLFLGI